MYQKINSSNTDMLCIFDSTYYVTTVHYSHDVTAPPTQYIIVLYTSKKKI